MRASPLRYRHQRQHGAALLMALIVVTLVTTLAASMVWQQWRSVQVEMAERSRAQSAWILAGALEWARIILREDARTVAGSGPVDHLGEPWAVPLAEARISTFLALNPDDTDDAPDTFFSGDITDAQARYNLRNLIDAAGNPVEAELQVLQRLCTNLDVSPAVATRILEGLRDARRQPSGRDNAKSPPLNPQRVDQLSWLGVDPESLKRLQPHVALLPDNTGPTPVNANTASREVLAAVIPRLDLGTAARLVQIRDRAPFKQVEDVQTQVGQGITVSTARISVSSNYFYVRGRVRLVNQVLEQRSLVRRVGRDVTPLTREWANTTDPG